MPNLDPQEIWDKVAKRVDVAWMRGLVEECGLKPYVKIHEGAVARIMDDRPAEMYVIAFNLPPYDFEERCAYHEADVVTDRLAFVVRALATSVITDLFHHGHKTMSVLRFVEVICDDSSDTYRFRATLRAW